MGSTQQTKQTVESLWKTFSAIKDSKEAADQGLKILVPMIDDIMNKTHTSAPHSIWVRKMTYGKGTEDFALDTLHIEHWNGRTKDGDSLSSEIRVRDTMFWRKEGERQKKKNH